MKTVIKGVHPYADEFPMASDDELAELAASIAAVGLINPVVLTPDGLVLDGRNRLKACEAAGVEPVFVTREGDDDDYKEFVIGANTTGRRESMTVQIAAASTALILGHEKRINGQWRRGSVPVSTESRTNTWQDAIRQAGLVLDVLGPAHLRAVRDGDESLNHVYEQARAEKQRQANEQERERQEAERKQQELEYATNYFKEHKDAQEWLAAKPDGAFADMRSALRALEAENDKVRREEEARIAKEAEAEREHKEAVGRKVKRLRDCLWGYPLLLRMAAGEEQDRIEILNALTEPERIRFLTIEKETTWPTSQI